MESKIKMMCGIAVFIFALVCNLEYALNDYNVTNSIFLEAMATDGGSGGGGGDTSGGWGWQESKTSSECTSTTTTSGWMCNGVWYATYQGSSCVQSTNTTTFTGVMTYCGDGTNLTCSERCVGK